MSVAYVVVHVFFFWGGVHMCSPVVLSFVVVVCCLGGLNIVVLSLVFVRVARSFVVCFECVFVWGD